MTGSPAVELDLLVPVLAEVADHVDHALRPARAGRCRAAATSPSREKSSSFSVISLQRKASFWIVAGSCATTSHVGCVSCGVASARRASTSCKPPFERLGAQGDRGQRVVDLVGHAGGQKADAGQLLAADDLLGPLADLAIEVVANFLEAGGHVVHRLGQLRHLVVRSSGGCDGRNRPAGRSAASRRAALPAAETASRKTARSPPAERSPPTIVAVHSVKIQVRYSLRTSSAKSRIRSCILACRPLALAYISSTV